jgi:hypothetical protein
VLIEEFVLDRLAEPGVTNLIGSRSYALLPQFDPLKVNYPAVVFRLSDREREYDHGGHADAALSRFEIICVGQKYLDVVNVANAVRRAFNNSEGSYGGPPALQVGAVVIEGEEDLPYSPEEFKDLSLFARGLAVAISHKEEL